MVLLYGTVLVPRKQQKVFEYFEWYRMVPYKYSTVPVNYGSKNLITLRTYIDTDKVSFNYFIGRDWKIEYICYFLPYVKMDMHITASSQ